MTPHPDHCYASQSELIEDHLDVMRLRLTAVSEHVTRLATEPRARIAWPAALGIAEAATERRTAATTAAGIVFPMMRLTECFGIGTALARVLWLLVAHELCPTARHLVRQLATEQVTDPTTEVIRHVAFGTERNPESWRAFELDGVLRRAGFVERTDANSAIPEHRQTWRASRRVLALVYGDLDLEPSLATIATIDASPTRDPGAFELGADVLDAVRAAIAREMLVIVHGSCGTGRRSILSAVAGERGRGRLVIDARSLAKDLAQARDQLRALAREARLLDLTPLILHLDVLEPTSDLPDRLALVETELDGLALATSTKLIARRWTRAPVTIEAGEISGVQRVRLWRCALPTISDADAEVLATMYPLAPAFITAAGAAAIAHAGMATVTQDDVELGLRSVLDDRLAGLATRVTTKQTWDDVVLPAAQGHAINELLARIRERRVVHEDWGFADKVGKGLGVAALFSGPPGTGKTMVAGLVARALRIELYQVDLSKIVSKWIGETEKNLAALFDAAEAGHACLLFDEADSLFGKRTDVRSSNDRHANQEVNFLLQRLESYKGICILTTNHETAIDEAFRRRLAIHVRFAMPDIEERTRLWEAMIPKNAPRSGDLRIEELADGYTMSGGYIRNAVLRAAFMAADEGGTIDARRLSRAAQLEYEAMGKIAPSNT